jgi:hypothetical protein
VSKFELFCQRLPTVAPTRADRAVLIVAYAKAFEDRERLTIKEIADYFEKAHLSRPNVTALAESLRTDRRVSLRDRSCRSLHAADTELRSLIPELFDETPHIAETFSVSLLTNAPFIGDEYVKDLKRMADFYKALHTLENSIRRLVEAVLTSGLGPDWWEAVASASMIRKHSDRLSKEDRRAWLPARSSLGPLYSLDWSDLVTIIRKYESLFNPYIGEIDFMHRYADLGLLRHVVAHNGFIDDESEVDRVLLALRDWNRQVGPLVRKTFGA